MLTLDLAEIMRIRSKLMEARAQSHKLVESSARLIHEHRETVERSHRLLERSRKSRLKAEERGRRAL